MTVRPSDRATEASDRAGAGKAGSEEGREPGASERRTAFFHIFASNGQLLNRIDTTCCSILVYDTIFTAFLIPEKVSTCNFLMNTYLKQAATPAPSRTDGARAKPSQAQTKSRPDPTQVKVGSVCCVSVELWLPLCLVCCCCAQGQL